MFKKKLVIIEPPLFSMSVNVIFEIWNARHHYSQEALMERARNRKVWMNSKYPDRPYIVTPGDKEWPN